VAEAQQELDIIKRKKLKLIHQSLNRGLKLLFMAVANSKNK
jgi:hypothetical protein